MAFTYVFVAALILVSGFIAYFGDQLGRWLGKKRLTLFNLRPKHTAYLVTSITGMLISGIVLAALVLTNVQFRQVLTEGEKIISENEDLIEKNMQLTKRSRVLEEEAKKLEDDASKRREQAKIALSAAKKAVEARDKALADVKKLQHEIAEGKEELAKLQKNSKTMEQQLAQKTQELDKVQDSLDSAREDLKGAQQRLLQAGDRLIVTKGELADAENNLESTRNRLYTAQEELEELRDRVDRQQKLLTQIGRERIDYGRQAADLRMGELIFMQGEEIHRGTIEGGKGKLLARGYLLKILDKASGKAEEIGAVDGENDRAVKVIYIDREQKIIIDDESECIDMAVETIAERPYDALVVLVSAQNSLAGEQVPVEIRLYRNKLVYKAHDLIAKTIFNGSESEGRILLSAMSFLQTTLSQKAARDGIVPNASSDPRSTMGADPKDQLEQLIEVVENIKSHNRQVEVSVYADTPVYASGPLNMNNMRFEITPVDED